MKYSKEEVMQYVQEENVKFIRLAFCDVFGKQKNISIMPGELPRAFESGIPINAAAIKGFGDEKHSELLLHPDADTLTPLPWRPEHGRVVRMFCTISYADGRCFECDTRSILKNAMDEAEKAGYHFFFGPEQKFYLFNLDENGRPTREPYDNAGYMDIAPEDKGENIRREVCLTLEEMGIQSETSHHEEGPGQNEISFRYASPLIAADDAMTFQTVVKTVAGRNGLHADFGPMPLEGKPGNGFHINISVKDSDDTNHLKPVLAGILSKIKEMTVFLNPLETSYQRFGSDKAPKYISWSVGDRSQMIRIPATSGNLKRAELRSPDSSSNAYLAFALIIYAGLYGLKNNLALQDAADINLYTADASALSKFDQLPENLDAARALAKESDFIKEHLPMEILDIYCN